MDVVVDLFYWPVTTTIILLLIVFLQWIFKTERDVVKSALLAGLVMTVANFLVEAFAGIFGMWMYREGFMMIVGVPLNVLLYFFLVGYGFMVTYDGLMRKLKSGYVHYASILAISSISTIGDMIYSAKGSIFFTPGWTPVHIFFVWLTLWYIDVSSFKFFRSRL